ncbi:signal peptidase I [Iodidimonas nitroreducens]|uniref:Signal peptidase I n=1 Tax=Iodidimonas nitroreducens TaxID=1236968 RepID=A0A5A7N5J6_9PROT|nr:signal peptidase I [Iodidimonas nitroreducens]GAK33848.1 signal peptidase I [alpha proteobacterium Q-1]GER03267.1 signal peptidase I [Iodidimonas nitroreducens]
MGDSDFQQQQGRTDEAQAVGTGGSVNKSFKNQIKETVSFVLSVALIVLGVRTILFEPFNIPSESMLPTLMVGDYLFVSKYAYGYSHHSIVTSPPLFDGRILYSAPERGDVVVFKLPRDNSTDYIKRVIGLPGDRVQMRAGALWINDQPVERERIADFEVKISDNTTCASNYRVMSATGDAFCRYRQYRETLPNGVSYNTLDMQLDGPSDNTRVFVVPEGHFFMMGDNRDNSQDSRRPQSVGVGYVPAENLVGRAEIIFFATDGGARLWEPWFWFQSIRYGRLFNDLH